MSSVHVLGPQGNYDRGLPQQLNSHTLDLFVQLYLKLVCNMRLVFHRECAGETIFSCFHLLARQLRLQSLELVGQRTVSPSLLIALKCQCPRSIS